VSEDKEGPTAVEKAASRKLGVGRYDCPLIYRDVAEAGTDSDLPYWLILGLSGGIATLGLAIDSAAVVIGFMVHLILDEIWSVEYRHGRFRLKKSFGTALKFWGNDLSANVSVYAKLILFAYLAWGDQQIIERLRDRDQWHQPYIAQQRDEPPPWEHWLSGWR
jgi:hypothetical protein